MSIAVMMSNQYEINIKISNINNFKILLCLADKFDYYCKKERSLKIWNEAYSHIVTVHNDGKDKIIQLPLTSGQASKYNKLPECSFNEAFIWYNHLINKPPEDVEHIYIADDPKENPKYIKDDLSPINTVDPAKIRNYYQERNGQRV